MKKTFIYLHLIGFTLFSLSCKKADEINKTDDLVGTWDLTNYEFKQYEDGVQTLSYSSVASPSSYLGELTFKEEGKYESDVINQMKEAYFLYGYSDNAIVDGFGSQGIWKRVSATKMQFDKGIPELVTNIKQEGHIIDFTVDQDSLIMEAKNSAQLQYYGYYNGKFFNTPSNFAPNAFSIVTNANGQATDYNIGNYYGYFLGFYEGQADRLLELGGDNSEPYWYGLLRGTISTVRSYSSAYDSNLQAKSGYDAAYNTRYLEGIDYADSLFTSPAKTYDLKYKFKRQ